MITEEKMQMLGNTVTEGPMGETIDGGFRKDLSPHRILRIIEVSRGYQVQMVHVRDDGGVGGSSQLPVRVSADKSFDTIRRYFDEVNTEVDFYRVKERAK